MKAVFRVVAKLAKRPVTEADELRKLDLDVLRPFCPTHNPVIDGLCREPVRFHFHCRDLADVELCERGERAMVTAAFEIIPQKHKRSADWHQALGSTSKLACVDTWPSARPRARQNETLHAAAQGGEIDEPVRAAKEAAVTAHNKLKQRCKIFFYSGRAWKGWRLFEFEIVDQGRSWHHQGVQEGPLQAEESQRVRYAFPGWSCV